MGDDELIWAAEVFAEHGGVDHRSIWLAHEDLAVLDRFRLTVGFGHVHRLRCRWSSASPAEAVAVYRALHPFLPGQGNS